ncbi:DNA damage-regulated autophagy modulator protein 2-like isoform X2 [Pomacea canaliculata]|uniref:DNA damage-regulated autophagy modulator protein 2-like isoform X2 n=1 Tax=Pomacea canaliculata TaxID=400727 RepID=UPI000D73FBC8|nr:DNA damage-regulated autophagy modulator protein 2-like isoform X2 [Pomacea canaliculata]
MASNQLNIYPAIMAFFLPATFLITYGIAVYLGHVEPVFPYISDTGTVAPESCVFGQLLNLFAALTAWCMYIRYKQVRHYYDVIEKRGLLSTHPKRAQTVKWKRRINKFSFGVGILCALGISIVGNFQEDNMLEMHLLGAIMAFGGAGLYCWVQTILSYKMASIPQSDSKCRLMRVILSTIQTTSFITRTLRDLKKWNSTQPGYREHVIAASSEWLMAIASSFFFITFVCELRKTQTKVLFMSSASRHMMDIEEDGTGPGSYPRQKYSPSKSPSDISTHLVDPVEQGTVYELEETCSSGNSGKDKNVNRRCK